MLSRLSRFPALARIAAFGVVVAVPAVALSVGSSPACAIYDSSLLLPGDGGDGSPPARMHALPPPRPVTLSEGGTVSSYVFAMQTIDIGVTDGGILVPDSSAPLAPFGFDLDNTITCPDQPSCVTPNVPKICDDDAGRDHIALQLFRDLGMTARNGSEQANAAMQAGQFGMLLQVSDYNGQANDLVTAALYVSNGINGVQDGGTVTPLHNGDDGWTVDPNYLLPMQNGQQVPPGTPCFNNPACQPVYVDTSAYVNDFTLVAKPTGRVPLTFGYRANIGGAVMLLDNVIISGKLVPAPITGVGTGFKIENGTISGRWETTALLANMATIPDPFIDGSFFCGQDLLYVGFKPFICKLQDINHDFQNDNTNPPSACDSLSMGFAFTAEPAHLGDVYPPPNKIAAGCTDEAGTAWHDQCQ